MAEITENITLGEAFEFARTRALTLDKGTEAKNIETLKNAVVAGKLGDNITLDSPYLSTITGEEFATQIGKQGKTKTNYYVNAQALEKYVNQGFLTQNLPTTNVIGASGTAKAIGVTTGQTRGTLPMRGMIPFEQIDKIYADGFSEMGKEVSEATKDFLIYHRYTNHRVSTVLTDKYKKRIVGGKEVSELQYKSLRLSDVSVFTDKQGNTVVTIAEAIRDKKKRFATTYTGSFAEFLKGVVEKAKSANPNIPNSEIKLFGTSESNINKAWKKHLLPKFVDRFESFLPVHTSGKDKGKVVQGLTQIVRSANIEALESDLKLTGTIGDDYMGHTPVGTKMKSYRVNTPESKAIGNVTENMVKTSAFNLNAGTVNNLFTGYGLNTPTLDVANKNVKVYDGHKSDFKFDKDELKKIVKPRAATTEEINLAKAKAETGIKKEKVLQTDLDIEDLSKQKKKLDLQSQVAELSESEKIKKAKDTLEQKELQNKLKAEKKLNLDANAWKELDPDVQQTLKDQGLWDDIVQGVEKVAKSKTGKAVISTATTIASKTAKSFPLVGGAVEYQESIQEGKSEQEALGRAGVETINPLPIGIREIEKVGEGVEKFTGEKIQEDLSIKKGGSFLESMMSGFGYPTGFSSGGFINKNQIRR